MKIQTNFVVPVRPLATRLLLAGAALGLLLAAAGTAFWWDGRAKGEQIQESLERLAQLEARRASLGERPVLPPVPAMAALRERVANINAMSVGNGRRLVPLLALFEELLPADAWLVSLNHKVREGEVVVVAEAERAEQLTQFLLNLEKSSRFAEVLLLRQAPFGTEGRRTVQFELRLKERT